MTDKTSNQRPQLYNFDKILNQLFEYLKYWIRKSERMQKTMYTQMTQSQDNFWSMWAENNIGIGPHNLNNCLQYNGIKDHDLL